jgi:predicted secreted protein
MRVSTLFIAATLAAMSLPAFADTEAQPVLDTVSLNLSAEDWVETTTARVDVAIDASLAGSDAGKIRGDMLKAVASLAGNADWKFAQFEHSQNQSGLEQWHAELEARIKEGDLGGLADKAKSASKPGLHLEVTDIDFTPTLAENQAVRARLRAKLYAAVNDELKMLNDAEPGRQFHVGEINFDTPEFRPVPMARHGMMASMVAPAPVSVDSSESAPIAVAQKVTMNAEVKLEAILPKGP